MISGDLAKPEINKEVRAHRRLFFLVILVTSLLGVLFQQNFHVAGFFKKVPGSELNRLEAAFIVP
jgi:hypothetical protein